MNENLSNFDIKKWLDERGIEWKSSGKNIGRGWIGLRQCVLPGCLDDHYHLGIELATGRIKCWSCGSKGTALRLIQIIDGCSLAKAEKTLLEFATDQVFEAKTIQTSSRVVLPLEIQDTWPEIHLRYLRSRNFDPDYLIPKYRLMPVYNVGDWRFRIICPIILDGKIMSFIGADVTREATLKYKNNPAANSIVPVNHSLYNLDSIREIAVIVEGITDVWRGGDGFIGTFTNNFTHRQIALLTTKKIKKAFVMYDPDKPKPGEKKSQSQKKQNQLALQLAGIIPCVEEIILDKGDPADMSEQEIKYLRKDIGL